MTDKGLIKNDKEKEQIQSCKKMTQVIFLTNMWELLGVTDPVRFGTVTFEDMASSTQSFYIW